MRVAHFWEICSSYHRSMGRLAHVVVIVGGGCFSVWSLGSRHTFRATHPPVSAAPSNEPLRVRQCELTAHSNCSNSISVCVCVRVCACLLCVCVRVRVYEWSSKMTDFSMNEILRSFRKMRMQRCSGQGSHLVTQHNHHHHHHQQHHHQQQQQQPQNFQPSTVQQSKDLKKIIKILKKNVIKAKITRKMKIVV
ncbi:uncharacterized protein LOC111596361 [Drosophila hydei]|uniref:Uncharacterized protein LOC111596361 n=1 Tax=Drosophila hydei TaxID=7224 RepID=A0A6J1LNB5_DROHY|nr:uncharacterized protein LOC111596361 [Drosophila hydei]